MDYDQTAIATTYDAARGYPADVLRQWLDVVAAHVPAGPKLIVDLGCGTGRFSQPLADRFGARVIGIDPSQNMLSVALAKPGDGSVEYQQAFGDRLPLDDGCADMVFMSMVLHHLPDVAATGRECRRVLREGGRVCIRNSTRDTQFPQSRFFPGMAAIVERELPWGDEVVRMLESAGLQSRAHEGIPHRVASNWAEFAGKIALRADSFLARLPDSDFEAGLTELRAYADQSDPEEAVTEVIDFFAFER